MQVTLWSLSAGSPTREGVLDSLLQCGIWMIVLESPFCVIYIKFSAVPPQRSSRFFQWRLPGQRRPVSFCVSTELRDHSAGLLWLHRSQWAKQQRVIPLETCSILDAVHQRTHALRRYKKFEEFGFQRSLILLGFFPNKRCCRHRIFPLGVFGTYHHGGVGNVKIE
jgi:hypothetical protein